MTAMQAARSLVHLTCLALVACGDDPPARVDASDTSAPADALDTAEPGDAPDATDATDSADAPDAADTTAADIDADVAPIRCDPDAACNTLLTPEGACPGACFAVPDRLTCPGTVVAGVCHVLAPTAPPTVEVDFGDYRVTPVTWGDGATLGEPVPLELRVTNDTDAALDVALAWRDPGLFTFADATWRDATALSLPARGTVALTATITATRATVFDPDPGAVATFTFGAADVFEPRATVRFPASEAIACGAERFPAEWCADPADCRAMGSFYVSARCCDDVFYPGALCCADADCIGGACVDGKCVYEAPSLTAADSAPLGNQRVALVLVDDDGGAPAGDPCADRSATRGPALDLAAVGAWYDALATRRAGAPTMALRWTVLSGVATSDLLAPGDPHDLESFAAALDAWLTERGCPLLGAYDKVVIAAPTLDLMGFGGLYGDHGLIGVTGIGTPYILAHELGHSFGATDLYLDLAGSLTHRLDLMGDNLGGFGPPQDGVLWGEVGFGDADRDGVLDVAEHAAFPETLEAGDLTATLTRKGALELVWHFVGREDGVMKEVVLADFRAQVPAAGYDAELWRPGRLKRLAFDGTQVDLDALRAAGAVDVHLSATLSFTDREWRPATRALDLATRLPLTIEE